MNTIPQISRRRSYKRNHVRKRISGFSAFGCSLLVTLLLLLGGTAAAFYYVALTRNLPSLELFPYYLEPPEGILLQPTELFDRSGEHLLLRLRDPSAEVARYLLVDQTGGGGADSFSFELLQATISNLDPDYWNAKSIPLKAFVNEDVNLLAQKLTSEIVMWDESPGLLRDLRVRLIAMQVVNKFGREKVLEWYLNSAKYGNYVYGADAAARVYLGKSATELNLAEGSLIAVIATAPDINPHTVPELVLERQKDLIQHMLDQGVITTDEADSASEYVFNFRDQSMLRDDFDQYTKFVLEQLSAIVPRDIFERGGYKIITAMDFPLQVQTQCAMQIYVTNSTGQQTEIPAIDGSECEAARLLPTIFMGIDEFPKTLNTVTAISDPMTGQLLSFASLSSDENDDQQVSDFPTGTVLTPYIYLTAFSRGHNPGSMVWDIPDDLEPSENDGLGSQTDVLNNLSDPYNGPIRLRTALANDYLRPAIVLMDQIGLENVITTLSRFGFNWINSSEGEIVPEQRIFTEEIGITDVIRAYGVLANQGVAAGQFFEAVDQTNDQQLVELSGILRLEDTTGNTLLDWSSPQLKSIVSPQLAYLVSNILSDESARWESLGHPNQLEIGRTVAVKLSHTLNDTGSWVIGYDTDRVVGVWIESPGNEGQHLLPRLGSGLWHALIQYALRDKPAGTWDVPPGISMVEVCDPSGLLPTPNCPNIVTETYLSGQEPTHLDMLYQSFQVNRETGNLATVFTPPELIEERVYMVVPPEAVAWARSEDFPLPPDDYDAVGMPSNFSPGIRIDSPDMFSHVRGKVSIQGSVGGEDFSFYRIQVGQGINPREWIQIGADINEAVNDGILATWDTSGLRGLYAIRLMSVHENQRVNTAIVQVTIDNQVPELTIHSPDDGQYVSIEEDQIVLVRVDAVDNLEVAKVDFYIDDQLLSELTLSPYVVAWDPRIGNHTLLVKVEDLAGNVSQETVEFTVGK